MADEKPESPEAPEVPVEKTDLEKLNESNAEMEKSLIKSRELKAEAQKNEAEKILGGTSGGHVEPTPEPKLSDEEYTNKFMKGEVDPLGEDGIKL